MLVSTLLSPLAWGLRFPRFGGHPRIEVEQVFRAQATARVPCGVQTADGRVGSGGSESLGGGPDSQNYPTAPKRCLSSP